MNEKNIYICIKKHTHTSNKRKKEQETYTLIKKKQKLETKSNHWARWRQ